MLTETNADSNVFALGIGLWHVWESENNSFGTWVTNRRNHMETNSFRSLAFAVWVRIFSNASEAEEDEGFPLNLRRLYSP